MICCFMSHRSLIVAINSVVDDIIVVFYNYSVCRHFDMMQSGEGTGNMDFKWDDAAQRFGVEQREV